MNRLFNKQPKFGYTCLMLTQTQIASNQFCINVLFTRRKLETMPPIIVKHNTKSNKHLENLHVGVTYPDFFSHT